jgi:hypothetical protein
MPVTAPCTSRELALALDDKASPEALVEGLLSGEVEIQFEHGPAGS